MALNPPAPSVQDLATMTRSEAEYAMRQAVQSVYLGDHVALTRILGFHKFFVDTRDVGFGAHVLLDGYWESWLTLFCLRNVKRGTVAIDVGANMGYYSVLFANNVGPEGRVIAVEPNPRTAALLRRSIDLNGFAARTQIVEMALSDGASTSARLVIPATESKNAHLSENESVALDAETLEIGCLTLDAMCQGLDRVDLVKIDAEGSEERIFSGMSGVLARHSPIVVIEINVARYADPARFVARLRGTYGELRYVSYDGEAVPVSEHELLSRNIGQDWLVVLSPRHPR